MKAITDWDDYIAFRQVDRINATNFPGSKRNKTDIEARWRPRDISMRRLGKLYDSYMKNDRYLADVFEKADIAVMPPITTPLPDRKRINIRNFYRPVKLLLTKYRDPLARGNCLSAPTPLPNNWEGTDLTRRFYEAYERWPNPKLVNIALWCRLENTRICTVMQGRLGTRSALYVAFVRTCEEVDAFLEATVNVGAGPRVWLYNHVGRIYKCLLEWILRAEANWGPYRFRKLIDWVESFSLFLDTMELLNETMKVIVI
ncbi:hypothetical protein BJ508DRAFT_316322 [Ascobolus immersus RN42]|uniref:Uncharacterized protein n=1 Tax=Ascobolus immersus RN42 TaxID=1160509 RepID=A0A3N4H6V3_ASCIM|nr:hypothetical protein BJ508DRAFT_316322 [Ascobolus immersus RN42]